MRPAVQPRQRGFSLLEVIAAVLLLAIAFGVLMQVAGSSLNLTRRAAERSEAALWARSKLDSAFALEPIRRGHSEGRFDATYRWQLDVTPWQGGPAMPRWQLYQLALVVSWGEGDQQRNARFTTLRLASNSPDGAAP